MYYDGKRWRRFLVLFILFPVAILASDVSADAPSTIYDTGKTVGAIWFLLQALGGVLSLFPKHTIVGKIGQWLVTFPAQFTPGGPFVRG